jgi:outer membrane protein assembly factor BamB
MLGNMTGRRLRARSAAIVLVVGLAAACLSVVDAAPAWAAPAISGFTPSSGPIGTAVTLQGSGFTGATSVKFAGVTATINSIPSDTTLVTTVPYGAFTGPISVTTPSGTASSSTNFTVTTGMYSSPSTVPPGATTNLYGSAFGPYEAVDVMLEKASVGSTTTDGHGNWRMLITGPMSQQPGSPTVLATGRKSELSSSTALGVRSDWLQAGYNARHRGVNPLENTLTQTNAKDLELDWTAKLTTGTTPRPGTIVVGGMAIAIDGSNVRAFSVANGAAGWTRPVAGTLTPPAASNGIVFVASSTGYVTAMYASTGAVLWSSCPTCATGAIPFTYEPTIANGLVYVIDDKGTVHELAVAGGQQVTTIATGFSPVTPAAPVAVQGSRVGVAELWTSGGTLYCIMGYIEAGKPYWSSTTQCAGGPVMSANTVFFNGYDGTIRTDGAIRWTKQVDTASAGTGSVAVTSDTVYAAVGTKLWALRRSDGSVLWSQPLQGGVAPSAGPTVANGVVYLPANAAIHLFSVSGTPLGVIGRQTVGYSNSGPVVVNGAVLGAYGMTVDAMTLLPAAQ